MDCDENYSLQRSWVEINQNQLRTNIKTYRQVVGGNRELIAVVKADAYGHGVENIVQVLEECQIKYYAVANLDEAIQLRKLHVKGEILILGYTPPEYASILESYNITQTILSEEYADLLFQYASPLLKCCVAIDTGMNRIGLKADTYRLTANVIRSWINKCHLVGIFTHLCTADSNLPQHVEFTKLQISKFDRIADELLDLNLPYVHCMNSAGALRYESRYSHFIRLGIVMYGLRPDRNVYFENAIGPVLSWKSVVSMVKTVQPGEGIGYGQSFHFVTQTKVATIPTGYADGYNRLLSNKGFVLIDGKKAPIIGKICMDQMMVNVSGITNVKIGSEVVLLGKSGNATISAEDMAQMCNTIGYEIICNISKRVPRTIVLT